MGNLITYSYVIPRTWDENYTEEELIPIIWAELAPYMQEHNNWFFGPIVTIAGVTTVLNVLSDRLCWWFAIPGDRTPSEATYKFSPNFINFGFWANREIIISSVEADNDADTIILEDYAINDNYRRDEEESARQQAIIDRQFYLIRQAREQNTDPEFDEGVEFDGVYEVDEAPRVASCQDPDSKIQELNREIFELKAENSKHKDQEEVINLLKRKLDISNRERARFSIDRTCQRQQIYLLEKMIENLKSEASGCVIAGPSSSSSECITTGPLSSSGCVAAGSSSRVYQKQIDDSDDDSDL